MEVQSFSSTASTQTKHQVKGRLLLDVVVAEGTAIFQLLSSENESLLVWGDAFLVLNLGLDVVDSVAWFDLERDGLSGKCLHEDLHTATQTKHQVKGRLFLDVVVAKSATVFELFPGKDKSLLVWGDAFFVLNLGLHVVDSVAWLDLERDGFSSKCLHEDLHTATQTKHQVKGGFLLDVVVTEGTAIFQLLSSENESLLVWGDAFLVLDLSLDVVDSVAWFDLERDGLSGKCLHEDLHTATQTKHQVKGGFLLDVVVAKSTTVFELFPGENESLLVWGDAFLVLNLGLDVVDSVAWFDLERDGLSGKCLHEDLHTATQTKHQVKGRLFLDVVVAKSATVFELFPGEDKSLLVWGDTFFVLNLGLHVVDSVAWFDLERDGFSGKCLHEDLHFDVTGLE